MIQNYANISKLSMEQGVSTMNTADIRTIKSGNVTDHPL